MSPMEKLPLMEHSLRATWKDRASCTSRSCQGRSMTFWENLSQTTFETIPTKTESFSEAKFEKILTLWIKILSKPQTIQGEVGWNQHNFPTFFTPKGYSCFFWPLLVNHPFHHENSPASLIMMTSFQLGIIHSPGLRTYCRKRLKRLRPSSTSSLPKMPYVHERSFAQDARWPWAFRFRVFHTVPAAKATQTLVLVWKNIFLFLVTFLGVGKLSIFYVSFFFLGEYQKIWHQWTSFNHHLVTNHTSKCLDASTKRCKILGGVSTDSSGKAERSMTSASMNLAKCKATGHQFATKAPLYKTCLNGKMAASGVSRGIHVSIVNHTSCTVSGYKWTSTRHLHSLRTGFGGPNIAVQRGTSIYLLWLIVIPSYCYI